MNCLQELEKRIETREAEIAVIGLGYVGLPLALEFAEARYRVMGIDLDGERVEDLNAGRSYLADVPSVRVRAQVAACRLLASTSYGDLDRADCINICVPTPMRQTRDPDVSHIVAALRNVRTILRPGQLVILCSTTYPGTTHELYRPMLEQAGLTVGKDVCLAFAPERIDPANTELPWNEVPKIVGGETELCARLAGKLFESIFHRTVLVSSSQAAEMVKLLENTFRMINIGLANEVAMMCDVLGLDVWEIIEAADTKPYGFMKFEPGPGSGGHCIPVDPNYLSWKLRRLNFNPRFIELASDINSSMPGWVVERAVRIMNRDGLAISGLQILLLGMAYKAEVADTRESPAADIFSSFTELGARVSYHDPLVDKVEIGGRTHESVELTDSVLEQADLVVITTAHSAVDYSRVCEHAQRVLDTRNATGPLGRLPGVERL